jgi:hypothetical protein
VACALDARVAQAAAENESDTASAILEIVMVEVFNSKSS